MTFELVDTGRWGYTLKVNDEIVMECLSKDEAMELSFGEIIDLMKELEVR